MNIEEFLKKFQELRDKSPHLFSTSLDNENCTYTWAIAYSKNCYYVFTGGWVEDSYYSEFLVKCKNCVDCLKVEGCELCYECTECYQCYNSDFLLNCNATRDSQYCYGLRDCSNCFLSSNQRHKSYLFKNRQCNKAEYEELVSDYKKTHTPAQIYGEWMQVVATAIRINLNLLNSENCLGDHISNSKNVYYSFDIVRGEDYIYCEEAGYGRDSCDVYVSGEGELLYECVGVAKKSYNCSFCIGCITCVNCEFCETCYNLNDCFGCFYLKGKRNYILNKPYTEENYKQEVADLKKKLIYAGKYHLGLFLA